MITNYDNNDLFNQYVQYESISHMIINHMIQEWFTYQIFDFILKKSRICEQMIVCFNCQFQDKIIMSSKSL